MKIISLLLTGGIIVLLLGVSPAKFALAQKSGSGWSQPIIISGDAPPRPGLSRLATILSTPDGFVHIFWEAITDTNLGGHSNIVYYLRGNGSSWSKPVDVIYAGVQQQVTLPSLALDGEGKIHALWTGGFGGDLVYTEVPAVNAGSYSAWNSPVLVAQGNSISGRLALDAEGNTYVVYSTRGSNALFFTRLLKESHGWSPAIALPGTENQDGDLGGAGGGIDAIAIDGSNRIHVTWTVAMGGDYTGRAFYARSTDGGRTWSFPLRLDPTKGSEFGVDSVNILTIGKDEIHLIWLADALRRHQWSSDGGKTWAQPESFMNSAPTIGSVFGHNGLDAMALDSAGVMHVISSGGNRMGNVGGVYHATWTKSGWTTPELLPPPDPQARASSGGKVRPWEWPSLTVANGNRLYLVWRDSENIWYSSKTIDAPYVPPTALPTLVLAQTAMPKTTPTPTTGTRNVPTATPIFQDTTANSATTSRGDPISSTLLGVVPVVLIILAVFASRLWRGGN